MSTIRINLLPHRQLRRSHQQRLLAFLAMLVAAAAVAVVVAGQLYLLNAKSNQDDRNAFLREEVAKLDKQIAEIKQLKEKIQDLLSRKDVVESLQSNRSRSVHLFDELARQLPDGLYLKSVKQNGDVVTLTGYAQSSARVSTLMRALEATQLFLEPTLVEVKSTQVDKHRANEFTLNVRIATGAEKTTSPAKGGKP